MASVPGTRDDLTAVACFPFSQQHCCRIQVASSMSWGGCSRDAPISTLDADSQLLAPQGLSAKLGRGGMDDGRDAPAAPPPGSLEGGRWRSNGPRMVFHAKKRHQARASSYFVNHPAEGEQQHEHTPVCKVRPFEGLRVTAQGVCCILYCAVRFSGVRTYLTFHAVRTHLGSLRRRSTFDALG